MPMVKGAGSSARSAASLLDAFAQAVAVAKAGQRVREGHRLQIRTFRDVVVRSGRHSCLSPSLSSQVPTAGAQCNESLKVLIALHCEMMGVAARTEASSARLCKEARYAKGAFPPRRESAKMPPCPFASFPKPSSTRSPPARSSSGRRAPSRNWSRTPSTPARRASRSPRPAAARACIRVTDNGCGMAADELELAVRAPLHLQDQRQPRRYPHARLSRRGAALDRLGGKAVDHAAA